MISEALRRLMREQKVRVDDAFAERERRRLEEVKAAFFEGMDAGEKRWFHGDVADFWLESNARRNLYAGPPLPVQPEKRALIRSRGRRRGPYDPQRDPGRVLADNVGRRGGKR